MIPFVNMIPSFLDCRFVDTMPYNPSSPELNFPLVVMIPWIPASVRVWLLMASWTGPGKFIFTS